MLEGIRANLWSVYVFITNGSSDSTDNDEYWDSVTMIQVEREHAPLALAMALSIGLTNSHLKVGQEDVPDPSLSQAARLIVLSNMQVSFNWLRQQPSDLSSKKLRLDHHKQQNDFLSEFCYYVSDTIQSIIGRN